MHHDCSSVKTACFLWTKQDKITTAVIQDNKEIAIMSKRNSRLQPAEDAKSYIQSSRDKPGFIERYIDTNKGRGVFASQPVDPGAFVLEYRGQLISVEECQSRHYTEIESTFLFEFEWQNHHWCIDASKEDGSLGRLVNDNGKSPNCIMKKIIVDGKPHLCLFAVRKIEIGEEIDYNYGDSKWPWRKKVKNKKAPAVVIGTSPIHHPSHKDSKTDDASSKVENKQTPTLAVETDISPIDHPTCEDSNKDDPSTQVIKQCTHLVTYFLCSPVLCVILI
ncbi:histone-lysine N-methyltransferase set-1-like isoform X1 [Channa argus]|uniref:histone-lysine N-methyltransferase set-1-like n=2 Tax=Channa argus TaxID=215402 RepID=UPI003521B0F6